MKSSMPLTPCKAVGDAMLSRVKTNPDESKGMVIAKDTKKKMRAAFCSGFMHVYHGDGIYTHCGSGS